MVGELEVLVAFERLVELGEWMCVGFSSEILELIYLYLYMVVDYELSFVLSDGH